MVFPLRYWPADLWASVFALAFAVFYALMTGFSVATQRSLIMVTVAVLQRIVYGKFQLKFIFSDVVGVGGNCQSIVHVVRQFLVYLCGNGGVIAGESHSLSIAFILVASLCGRAISLAPHYVCRDAAGVAICLWQGFSVIAAP
jgi:hypothetical protein